MQRLVKRPKLTAALDRVKDVIARAAPREVGSVAARKRKAKKTPFKAPHIRRKDGRKFDLTGFDFDDLLG